MSFMDLSDKNAQIGDIFRIAGLAIRPAGISLDDVNSALIGTMIVRDGAYEAIAQEAPSARLSFYVNTMKAFAQSESTPKTWPEFFEVMRNGVETAISQSDRVADPKKHESLERIRDIVSRLNDWYMAQDRRLHPLMNQLGRVKGFQNELSAMLEATRNVQPVVPQDSLIRQFFP